MKHELYSMLSKFRHTEWPLETQDVVDLYAQRQQFVVGSGGMSVVLSLHILSCMGTRFVVLVSFMFSCCR